LKCLVERAIEVVYAREVDRAEQRSSNPSRWKAAAFIQQAEKFRKLSHAGPIPNL
jgi:hypothetical protein